MSLQRLLHAANVTARWNSRGHRRRRRRIRCADRGLTRRSRTGHPGVQRDNTSRPRGLDRRRSYHYDPVDLAAAAGDPAALDRAVNVVVGSGEVDSVVITGFVGDPDPDAPPDSPAKQIIVSPETASRAHRLGVPLVVQALFDDSPAVDALRGQPVARYRTGSSIGQVFQAAVTTLAPRSGVPPLPAPAEAELTRGGYFEARELLSSHGIGFARSRRAGVTEESVIAAADGLTYPLVLKAVDRLHKSDDGGVSWASSTRSRFAASAYRSRISA